MAIVKFLFMSKVESLTQSKALIQKLKFLIQNAFLFVVEKMDRWKITKLEISSTELQTIRMFDFFLSRNKSGVCWI